MNSDHPGRWLAHHAKLAVTELPENTGWLMRKFLTPPPVERAASEARGRARRVSDSVADAIPFGPDSLDLQLHRAQEALEDAERAEERALHTTSEANALAERVKSVIADGRRRRQEAKAAGDAETKRRVADARRRAEAMIAEERDAAEADAGKRLDEIAEQNESEREDAERRAEEAHQRAEAQMTDARQQLAEARALADQAAEAARTAAEEAHRRARAMTEQAEAQSRAADARATEADRARGSVTLQTAEFVRVAEKEPSAEGLADRTKTELLDPGGLAADRGAVGHDQGCPGDGHPPDLRQSPRCGVIGQRVMTGAGGRLWRRTLVAGVGAVAVTAASAIVSSLRRREGGS